MNWGTGIVLVFVGFATIMISMVRICMKQDDLHLVEENYYAETIRYQSHIDKVGNTQERGQQVMRQLPGQAALQFALPAGASGEVHLFRPSDARLDQRLSVAGTPTEEALVLPLESLKAGYWKAKLTWQLGEQAFYEELSIHL